MIVCKKNISRAFVRSHTSDVFVFGDNEQRRGYGGMAYHVRGEPNSIGVRTKKAPSNEDWAFWTDDRLDDNCRMIDEDLALVEAELAKGRVVVLPENGLGTGLSQMHLRCPMTFRYLDGRVSDLIERY